MDRTKRRLVGFAANSNELLHWREKKVNFFLKKGTFPVSIEKQGEEEKQRKTPLKRRRSNRASGLRGQGSRAREFRHLRTKLTKGEMTSEISDQNSAIKSKKHAPLRTWQARNRPMKETADRADALNKRKNLQNRGFQSLQQQREQVHKQQKQLLQQQKHLQQQRLYQPRHHKERSSQALQNTRAESEKAESCVKTKIEKRSNDGKGEKFSKKKRIKLENKVPLHSYGTRQRHKTRSSDFAAAEKRHERVAVFRKCEQVQTVTRQSTQRMKKKSEAPVKQRKTKEDVGDKCLFSKPHCSRYSSSSNHNSSKNGEESARELHGRWRSRNDGFRERSSERTERDGDRTKKHNIINCSSSGLESAISKRGSKRNYQSTKALKYTVSWSSRSNEGSRKSGVQRRTLQRSSIDSRRLRIGVGKRASSSPLSPCSLKRAKKVTQLDRYPGGNLSSNKRGALIGIDKPTPTTQDAAGAYESVKESSLKEEECSEGSVGEMDFGVRIQPNRFRKATRYKTLLEAAKRKGKGSLEKDPLLDTYFFSGRTEDFCEEEDDDWTPQKVYGFENAKRRLRSKQSESSSSDDEEDDDDDDSGTGDSSGAKDSDSDTTE